MEPGEPLTLETAKKWRIATINDECSNRIFAKWPAGLQSSIGLGLYPGLVDLCKADIATTVAASNAQGRDVINACATIGDAQAVTVVWPII